MSFFSLGRNKDTASPAFRPDTYAPQSLQTQQPQPQSPPSRSLNQQFADQKRDQKRSSSFRRRLSKPQRLLTGTRGGPLPVVRKGNNNNNNNIDLGTAFSTSPLAMTFGADTSNPASSRLEAAAAAGALAGANTAAAVAEYTSPASSQHQQQGSTLAAAAGTPANSPLAPEVLAARVAERMKTYDAKRINTVKTEAAMAFDYDCIENATDAEKLANQVLLRLKKQDEIAVFQKAGMRTGFGNQKHKAFAGDHFLTNVSLLEDTHVLRAARRAPKGAHLHIHYNACLKPRVLLDLAEKMDRMFITSDLPLVFVGTDDSRTQNFYLCEIQFQITSVQDEKPGNLFDPGYSDRKHMQFREFLRQFPQKEMGMAAMDWLESKLVFSEKETYDIPQTSNGAWERFNGRTRMMKGLFNYETVYRKYTELFLQDLLNDNIQYAEIRPNFMTTNQLWNDDGTAKLDNAGIVKLIIGACEAFKKAHKGVRNFDGIKIIYCTPRSFPNDKVKAALDECILFKQTWPEYIAGFDLVGQESMGKPLRQFVPEFIAFQEECAQLGIKIPFLFHCGETLDMGTDVDGNLIDALLLNSKRIGHGFALPRHPHILQEMKRKNVCVEVCPISNEILGLTPRIGGHAVYSLLAQNVPCTINSDNGTLFQSSLSHDFYQVLVGKSDMGLFGWRQLAEWSLIHSCFSSDSAMADARVRWLEEWRDYVVWLLTTYDAENPETQRVLAEIAQDRRLAARASKL
ncbi:hypothetical protein SBRCBS47491_005752 [Sporothrix bragantina]|uniref:Adenosine deaminase domain-containing protein n=1 Tax=Sporothrix bragantina TaxID=671064 RepID=A0ABP0BZA7_9PEZI